MVKGKVGRLICRPYPEVEGGNGPGGGGFEGLAGEG